MPEYRTMRRQQIVAIVNRTHHPLEVMDDGIPVVLPPGYRKLEDGRVIGAGKHGEPVASHLPLATANRAMDQNKQRGTVNPNDFLDCVCLLGRVGADEISYVDDEPDPEAELFDRSMLPEAQRAVKMNTGIGRRRTHARREVGLNRTISGMVEVAIAPSTPRSLPPDPIGNRPYEGGDI